MAAKIYYIGSKKENSDIDVAVETTQTTAQTTSPKILIVLGGLVMVALLAVLTIFSTSALMRQKSGEMFVTSRLTNDEGDFAFKGWEMTPALEAAVEAGNISLKEIAVIEKGGEISFKGGDADKIAVINYETVIEKNVSPKLYSDEYWEELCKKGENTYVLRTIGLSTEATEKESAE